MHILSFPRRWWSLPRDDRALMVQAARALVCASLEIRFLPFRTVMARENCATIKGQASEPVSKHEIARVTWAVNALARRLPWRIVCFQKGLATHRLLHRRGIASLLHYGVAQNADEGVKAHVWVTYAGRAVIGGEEAAGYTCLATFPPSASTNAAAH